MRLHRYIPMGGRDIHHTEIDCIAPPGRLLCWGFDTDRLSEEQPGFYCGPVYEAFYQACRHLSASKDRQLRDRLLTAWAGDYRSEFVLAVPAKTPVAVLKVLRRYLGAHKAHVYMEEAEDLPLAPRLRYAAGVMIEYQGSETAGTTWVDSDDEEHYGTGLLVYARAMLPAVLNGGEEHYWAPANGLPHTCFPKVSRIEQDMLMNMIYRENSKTRDRLPDTRPFAELKRRGWVKGTEDDPLLTKVGRGAAVWAHQVLSPAERVAVFGRLSPGDLVRIGLVSTSFEHRAVDGEVVSVSVDQVALRYTNQAGNHIYPGQAYGIIHVSRLGHDQDEWQQIHPSVGGSTISS